MKNTIYLMVILLISSCDYKPFNTTLYSEKELKMFICDDVVIFCWGGITTKGKIIRNNTDKRTITMMKQNGFNPDLWVKQDINYDDIKYCFSEY